MARYIDKDALLKHYKALANIEWNKKAAPASWCDAFEDVVEHIEELPTADVAPKSEVAREILSNLKKTVHDKAVYSYTKEMFPYINLKVFDAIIQNYLMKYAEERKE